MKRLKSLKTLMIRKMVTMIKMLLMVKMVTMVNMVTEVIRSGLDKKVLKSTIECEIDAELIFCLI